MGTGSECVTKLGKASWLPARLVPGLRQAQWPKDGHNFSPLRLRGPAQPLVVVSQVRQSVRHRRTAIIGSLSRPVCSVSFFLPSTCRFKKD